MASCDEVFWKPIWVPPDISNLTMVALYAYFDESGKFHDGQGYICLCGYIGSDADWGSFMERWIPLRRQHKFDFIHLTEFESECRRRGWGEVSNPSSRTADVLKQFIRVIRDSPLAGFSVGVDGRYFARKFELDSKRKVDPAVFAVQRILRQMRDVWTRQGRKPQLCITFDEDAPYSIKCYQIISRLRMTLPDLRKLIISISFADDRFFPPLQAADILANLTNRYWRDNLDKEAPEPPDMLRLLLSETDKGAFIASHDFWNRRMIDANWDQLRRIKY